MVKDVHGSGVQALDNVGNFLGYFPRAKLLLNEVFCGGTAGRDLIELRATTDGSTANASLTWEGNTKPDVLAVLPDTVVAAGDLIVIHLGTDPLKGDAYLPETTSKDEQTASTNYPGAWDFPYEDTACDVNEGVMRIRDANDQTMDGVAFWNSSAAKMSPDFTASWLPDLQAENEWLPKDCGGAPCGVDTTPAIGDICVDQKGSKLYMGNMLTLSRKAGEDTNAKADWSSVGPGSIGLPNP
jgi:hypothetical protein